jgi:hypothetical protein
MRGLAIGLVVPTCVASLALSGTPDTPLDCSDFVFVDSGFSCSQGELSAYRKLGNHAVDNDGHWWAEGRPERNGEMCGTEELLRREFVRCDVDTDTCEPIFTVDQRCVEPWETYAGAADACWFRDWGFDAVRGRIYIVLETRCTGEERKCSYTTQHRFITIEGEALRPLADVLGGDDDDDDDDASGHPDSIRAPWPRFDDRSTRDVTPD